MNKQNIAWLKAVVALMVIIVGIRRLVIYDGSMLDMIMVGLFLIVAPALLYSAFRAFRERKLDQNSPSHGN